MQNLSDTGDIYIRSVVAETVTINIEKQSPHNIQYSNSFPEIAKTMTKIIFFSLYDHNLSHRATLILTMIFTTDLG